jgi:site-specific DNA recombinase
MAKARTNGATGTAGILPVALRAAIYCRVSTSEQEEQGTSLESQEAACRQYAADHGYSVLEAYVYREAYSGFQLERRERLAALRAAVRARELDVVICYALDRLSRKQTHLGILLEELEQSRTHLEMVTEQFEDTAVGKFLMAAKSFAAELEREKIRERSLRGKLQRVRNGQLLRGTRPPYGYRWHDEEKLAYALDPETALYVRQMFAWAAIGVTLREIAQRLNAMGARPPRQNRGWVHTSIRGILTNPTYTGHPVGFRYIAVRNDQGGITMQVRPKDEQVPLPAGLVPPLVSVEAFEQVQARLRLNQARASRNNRYPEAALLRGGFVRCGRCGATLSPRRVGPGGKWFQYRCIRGMSLDTRCTGTHVATHLLDADVWSKVTALLTDPRVIAEQLAQHQAEDPTEADLAPVERALTKIENQQRNLVGQLADLPPTVAPLVHEKLAALEQQRLGFQQERERLQGQRAAWAAGQAQLAELEAWCRQVAANVEGLSFAERRLALDALGLSVQVWPKDRTPRYEITARIPLPTPIVDTSPRRWAGRSWGLPSSGRPARG